MMNWARAWRRAAYKWRKRCRQAERECRKWRMRYGVIGKSLIEAGYAPTDDRMAVPPEYVRLTTPEANRDYPVYDRGDANADVYR